MEVTADIPRNASDMAASVALLLQASRKLIFIDPHFGPENARHRRPLKAFLEAATRNRTVPLDEIEYHLGVWSTKDYFDSGCAENLPKVIPSEYDIRFNRWRQVPEGEKLHDRFILTELGGVEFSVGLDDGSAGETTKVHILSDKSYSLTWDMYLSENPAYEFVDDVIVKGTRR